MKTHVCPECLERNWHVRNARRFRTTRGMAIHRNRAHGVRADHPPAAPWVQRPLVPYRCKTLHEFAADPSGAYVLLEGTV